MPNYSSPRYHLAKLLAHHENAAAAIRQTMALLAQLQTTGRGRPAAPATEDGLLGQAIQLDRARRAGKVVKAKAKAKAKKAQKELHYSSTIQAQRERSAAYLQHFSAETYGPLPPGPKFNGLGALVRRGYLKRKGKDYLRTGKPYSVKLGG